MCAMAETLKRKRTASLPCSAFILAVPRHLETGCFATTAITTAGATPPALPHSPRTVGAKRYRRCALGIERQYGHSFAAAIPAPIPPTTERRVTLVRMRFH